MLPEVRDTYSHKHTCPMAAVLDGIVLDGFADQTTGDVEWGAFTARIGRRLFQEDSLGFTYYARFATVGEACAEFDRIEALYAEWCESDE